MSDEEFGAYLAKADNELAEAKELAANFGLGASSRWWADQETSRIQYFDAADKLVLQADWGPITPLVRAPPSRASTDWPAL
jgi:hypothetical protein